jgi:mRNA turnover protein 4
MPKSKRAKIVNLTKTKKVGTREKKDATIETVHSCFDDYTDVYVFDYSNCRSKHLKDARIAFRDESKFFLTKNKILKVALSQMEEEYKDISKIGEDLVGLKGLLFTNKPKKEVLKFFKEFHIKEFAKEGFVSKEKVELKTGPLEFFPHSLEPRLAKLGLPVELKNGIIHLVKDFVVCQVGDKLTPEQAKILKHLEMEMAEFSMNLVSHWSNNKFETFKK